MNTLARIISIVLHPLLMPTYLMIMFSYLFPAAMYPIKAESRLPFIGLLFALTFLIPAVNILLFKMLGVVSSISMRNRSERIKPFILIVTLYGLFTYMLYYKSKLSIGDNLFNIVLIIDALVIITFLITFFYKVSMHSAGIWGVIGMLLPMNKVVDDGSLFIPTLIGVVLAGSVMSSRLQLNAHTPREVLVGSLTGFGIGFFGMLILFN